MRVNRYISMSTGVSRRRADQLIAEGRAQVDSLPAKLGQVINDGQKVYLDKQLLQLPEKLRVVILNKPIDYVVSRKGQGSKTIYDLLPAEMSHLKAIGRLDKDSSGLIVLTNDGQLAQSLGHPSSNKLKIYNIWLNKPLTPNHEQLISGNGIKLVDGLSHLNLKKIDKLGQNYLVSMTEGRNRQIRRTFEAVGYKVTVLNRTQFGDYVLGDLGLGEYIEL